MTAIASAPAATASTTTDLTPARRRLVRAGCVAAGGAATAVLFGIGSALGADFVITDPVEGAVPHPFTVVSITIAALVIGLGGWFGLAVLERITRRAHQIWGTLAVGLVVLSMVPIWIEIATTGTRIGLFLIHLAVGAALLPMMRARTVR